jgi:putative transposase
MRCVACGSSAVSERPERTAQGYRQFRYCICGKQFNKRNLGLLNRTQHPSDVIALVVLWRARYKLSLRDLAEMFLIRGIAFSYEAVRDWEAIDARVGGDFASPSAPQGWAELVYSRPISQSKAADAI